MVSVEARLTKLERLLTDLVMTGPAQERQWTALPHQNAPAGDWSLWLLLGGRGSGKTDAMSHYIDHHVNGPPCIVGYPGGHRPAIIAPTLGDAVESCVNGPSGLKAHNPLIRLVQTAGGTYVRWPNGVEGKLFGAYSPEDVERLRAGGNRCVVWAEELAAWQRLDEAWDHMTFGLRLGEHPRVVASTTPKPRPRLKALMAESSTTTTTAHTDDNPFLAPEVRGALIARYGGTRLGRQELAAEILDDVPGALWKRQQLEQLRVKQAPDLVRVVVAVDPSGSTTGNEQGIVVAGKGADGHGYVVGDASCSLSPEGWARRAVNAYHTHKADRLVAEKNFGGDMVAFTVRTADPTVAVKLVNASRGKQVRAEPIAALYEQGKVHHVGAFPDLEDQLCTWDPGDYTDSPDRLDALVWALSELMLFRSEVRFF
jgi:phage terminase large subunit-like protein